MSGSIRIEDMPSLGAPTDDMLFLTESSGTGTVNGAALRDFVLAGGTVDVLNVGTLVVTGPTTLEGALAVDGNIDTHGHVAGAGVYANSPTNDFGLLVGGSDLHYLQWRPGYWVGHSTSNAVVWSAPGGPLMSLDSVGALRVNGAIGQLNNTYLELDGGTSFSTPGSASLIINGGTRPTYAFEFYGNGVRTNAFDGAGGAYKPGGGAWSDISDERLKQDVADYTAGLPEICELLPRMFTFKPECGRGDQMYYGLIAQECEDVMPEMVTQKADHVGTLSYDDMRFLDTTPLIFALVNAVKTLAGRLDELEAEAR